MYITGVKSGGTTYYYARKTQRINGEPKVVWSLPLGTAEDIVRVFQEKYLKRIKFKSFDFGIAAALYSIAEELNFFNTVENVVEKKDIGGITPSQYLFLIIAGRAYGPKSKSETGRWFHESFLELRWTPEHSLSCQNFLNHMDYLTDDVIEKIEDGLGQRLIELNIKLTTLFWDTTNFSTCIENWDEDSLPQSGNAKDKRYDRNIIGLGVATGDDNIPFMHESYPGNEHDSKVLNRMVEKMVARLEKLRVNSKDVVLIFDQGGNSPKNIEAILDKMHIVGSLKRDQVKDLFELPLKKYKFLYESGSGGQVYGYITKRNIWEKEFTVVITHNEQTAKRKERTWERNKKRIQSGMEKLAQKYGRKNGKGRKMTLKGLTESIHDLIPKQYRSIIRWDVDQSNRTLIWRIDETEEKNFKLRMGKTVIFTDMHEWSTAKIVKTYHRKSQLEDDFRWLHGKLGIPVPPYYVRLDRRIRVHAFLCVLGMVFLRFLGRRLASLRVSPQRIWSEMEKLKVALMKDVNTEESELVLEEMNPIQSKVFDTLGLSRFLSLN